MYGLVERPEKLRRNTMVKHIILWTLKDEYTEAQKKEIRAGIKEA